MAAWNELPPSGELPECTALLELAERLRGSAPELVVHYAHRVLADSGGSSGAVAVRARGLLAGALVRLGRHAEAIEPAMAALRGADLVGVPEFASAVRLDLAACSIGVGEPLLGCAILRPVLDATGARPATRAGAIERLVGCTAHVGRRDDLEDSLAEADRLLAADDGLSADARRMERALLSVRTAAYHRRYGESEDAIEAAHDGLGLLARLRDARLEGGRVRVSLVLEVVCALLDDGQLAEAEHEAGPTLAQPVRAASAPAMGRLLLAIATRVLLPAGRVEAGRGLLDHATWIAERHGLDWLLADGLTAKADLDEQAGRPADALQALRAAHAAEHRHRRSIELARRRLMVEFGAREPTTDAVNSLLRNVIRVPAAERRASQETTRAGVPAPLPPPRPRMPVTVPSPATDRTAGADGSSSDAAETDATTGLLTREGLSRRLEAARRGNRPVALTLVRLDTGGATVTPTNGSGPATGAESSGVRPDALAALAGRVRDIAPVDAELARPAGSELAVLLPHTTRDQAEEFAATIRESAVGPEVSISTGVAQSGPGPATGEDADYLLSAAREMLTPAPASSDRLAADRNGASSPAVPDQVVSDESARTNSESSAAPNKRELSSEDPTLGGPRGSSQWELTSTESLLRGLAALTAVAPEDSARTSSHAEADDSGDDDSVGQGLGSGRAIRELLAPLLDHPTLSHRGSQATVPRVPEPEEIPEPPEPDELPRVPAPPDVVRPPEPSQVPPAPGPEPAPEVPPPSEAREQEPPTVVLDEAVLGPIQGPEPRPPDLPPRPDRATLRRDRADTTSIADLLTEALVAYQAGTPEEPPASEPEPENLPPAHRSESGRHRMPDWASSDLDRF